MAEISKITLPNGNTYDLKDAAARQSIGSLQTSINNYNTSALHFVGETTTELKDGGNAATLTLKDMPESAAAHTVVSGDVAIYQEKEFVATVAVKTGASGIQKIVTWHEFGSTGSLKALAFKDSASASYTPAGSVSQPTFTGAETTVNVEGTASATPTARLIFEDPNDGTTMIPAHQSGDNNYIQGAPKAKATGAKVTLNTSSIQQITGVGTLPAMTTSVSGETLTLGWNAGTLPTKAAVTVATGVNSVTQPTVTIGTMDITFNPLSATVNSTGKVTPSGTVSKPTFAGSAATISVK